MGVHCRVRTSSSISTLRCAIPTSEGGMLGVPVLSHLAFPDALECSVSALSYRDGEHASDSGREARRFTPAERIPPEGRWRCDTPPLYDAVTESVAAGAIRPK